MVKFYLFSFIILLQVSRGQAQQRVIDSLTWLLQEHLSQTDRIDVLNELSYTLYDTDDSAAFHYATIALAESRKTRYRPGERYAHTLIGLGHYNSSEYKKALASLRASAEIKVEEKKELAGYNIMLMGSINRDLGHYDSAEYYFQLAINTIGEKG